MVSFITSVLSIKNLRLYVILFLVGAAVWIWKDYQNMIRENARITQNAESLRKADSIGFSQQILTKDEMIEDLKYNRQDLVKKLEDQNIKLNRITRLISTKNTYNSIDTTRYLLNEILKGIYENRAVSQAVKDSTECHMVEALIHFNGNDLRLDVTKVSFTSMSDIVAHTEKVGLRFWKWFRKKKVTITVLNSCGETQTKLVEVKKR